MAAAAGAASAGLAVGVVLLLFAAGLGGVGVNVRALRQVQPLGGNVDIRLRTAADGLAVSRPSGFVGETVKEMVGGGFTVSDEHLFTDLHALHETERLFVEPSACAGFAGAVELSRMTDYLESSGLGTHWENAAHIVWATVGALGPEGEREKYLAN